MARRQQAGEQIVAFAAAGTPPRRLILVTHGNGSVLEKWRENPGARFRDGAALPTLTGPILAAAGENAYAWTWQDASGGFLRALEIE